MQVLAPLRTRLRPLAPLWWVGIPLRRRRLCWLRVHQRTTPSTMWLVREPLIKSRWWLPRRRQPLLTATACQQLLLYIQATSLTAKLRRWSATHRAPLCMQ